jgi:hypothetical protein
METTDFDDEETGPKRTDVAALRILATWVADHDGVDPSTGATFDREFVLVDGPTRSTHRLA